jgi:hypothetical protein
LTPAPLAVRIGIARVRLGSRVHQFE